MSSVRVITGGGCGGGALLLGVVGDGLYVFLTKKTLLNKLSRIGC